MKNRIASTLALLLVIVIAGCSHTPAQTTGTTTITVASTRAAMPATVLVGALQLAGMPITNVIDCNGQTDPAELLGLPNQYTFKAIFSLPADHGETLNAVEVFMNDVDAAARFSKLESAAVFSSSPVGSNFLSGKYILLLSPHTSATEAENYRVMFLKIVGN